MSAGGIVSRMPTVVESRVLRKDRSSVTMSETLHVLQQTADVATASVGWGIRESMKCPPGQSVVQK